MINEWSLGRTGGEDVPQDVVQYDLGMVCAVVPIRLFSASKGLGVLWGWRGMKGILAKSGNTKKPLKNRRNQKSTNNIKCKRKEFFFEF